MPTSLPEAIPRPHVSGEYIPQWKWNLASLFGVLITLLLYIWSVFHIEGNHTRCLSFPMNYTDHSSITHQQYTNEKTFVSLLTDSSSITRPSFLEGEIVFVLQMDVLEKAQLYINYSLTSDVKYKELILLKETGMLGRVQYINTTGVNRTGGIGESFEEEGSFFHPSEFVALPTRRNAAYTCRTGRHSNHTCPPTEDTNVSALPQDTTACDTETDEKMTFLWFPSRHQMWWMKELLVRLRGHDEQDSNEGVANLRANMTASISFLATATTKVCSTRPLQWDSNATDSESSALLTASGGWSAGMSVSELVYLVVNTVCLLATLWMSVVYIMYIRATRSISHIGRNYNYNASSLWFVVYLTFLLVGTSIGSIMNWADVIIVLSSVRGNSLASWVASFHSFYDASFEARKTTHLVVSSIVGILQVDGAPIAISCVFIATWMRIVFDTDRHTVLPQPQYETIEEIDKQNSRNVCRVPFYVQCGGSYYWRRALPVCFLISTVILHLSGSAVIYDSILSTTSDAKPTVSGSLIQDPGICPSLLLLSSISEVYRDGNGSAPLNNKGIHQSDKDFINSTWYGNNTIPVLQRNSSCDYSHSPCESDVSILKYDVPLLQCFRLVSTIVIVIVVTYYSHRHNSTSAPLISSADMYRARGRRDSNDIVRSNDDANVKSPVKRDYSVAFEWFLSIPLGIYHCGHHFCHSRFLTDKVVILITLLLPLMSLFIWIFLPISIHSSILGSALSSSYILSLGGYSLGNQYKGADVCAMVIRLWLLFFYLRPAMPPSVAIDTITTDDRGTSDAKLSNGTFQARATDIGLYRPKKHRNNVSFSSPKWSNKNKSRQQSCALGVLRMGAHRGDEATGAARYIVDSLHTMCYLWYSMELQSIKEASRTLLKGYNIAHTDEAVDIVLSEDTIYTNRGSQNTLSSKTASVSGLSNASGSGLWPGYGSCLVLPKGDAINSSERSGESSQQGRHSITHDGALPISKVTPDSVIHSTSGSENPEKFNTLLDIMGKGVETSCNDLSYQVRDISQEGHTIVDYPSIMPSNRTSHQYSFGTHNGASRSGLINPPILFQINNFDVLFDHYVHYVDPTGPSSTQGATTGIRQSAQRIVLLASTYHPNERSRNLFSSEYERHFVLLAMPCAHYPSNANCTSVTVLGIDEAIQAISVIMSYRLLFDSFFRYIVMEDTVRKDLRRGQRVDRKQKEFEVYNARKVKVEAEKEKAKERGSENIPISLSTAHQTISQQVIDDAKRDFEGDDEETENPLITEMREDEVLAEESIRSALRHIVFDIPLPDTLLNSNTDGAPPVEVDKRYFALKAVSFVRKEVGVEKKDASASSRKVYLSAMCCDGTERQAENPFEQLINITEGHITSDNVCASSHQSSHLLANIIDRLLNRPNNGKDQRSGDTCTTDNHIDATSNLHVSNYFHINEHIDAYLRPIVWRSITSSSLLVVCSDNNGSSWGSIDTSDNISPLKRLLSCGVRVSYIHTTNSEFFAELVFRKKRKMRQEEEYMSENIITVGGTNGDKKCPANLLYPPSHLFLDGFALRCLSSWALCNTNTEHLFTSRVTSLTPSSLNGGVPSHSKDREVFETLPGTPIHYTEMREVVTQIQTPVSRGTFSAGKERRLPKVRCRTIHPLLNPVPNPYIAHLQEMYKWCGHMGTSNMSSSGEGDAYQQSQGSRLSPPPCGLHTESLTFFLATGYPVSKATKRDSDYKKYTFPSLFRYINQYQDNPSTSEFYKLQCTPCERWFLGVFLKEMAKHRCPTGLWNWIKRRFWGSNTVGSDPIGNKTSEEIVRALGAGAAFEVDN